MPSMLVTIMPISRSFALVRLMPVVSVSIQSSMCGLAGGFGGLRGLPLTVMSCWVFIRCLS
jgi:hypothetical protein